MINRYWLRIIYKNDNFKEIEINSFYLLEDRFNYKYYNGEGDLRYGVLFNLSETLNKIEIYENGKCKMIICF